VTQGFHGEAAIAPWQIREQSETACELDTWLAIAPLHLRRSVRTNDQGVVVTDTIHNLSPDPVLVRIVQHPAFGAPFLDGHSRLIVASETLITDSDAPGSLAPADAVGTPAELLSSQVDDRGIRLPGPNARESLFGALTDFTAPKAVFESPTHGFGIRLPWDAVVFPRA
jgi:hypothetical protein